MARLVRAVRTWLTGQGPQPDGLGTVHGRVDLRGIPLTASPATIGDPDDPGRGVTWEALDLSGAQLDGLRFFGSTIEDCTFDRASLLDLRLWGTTVRASTFRRTSMPSAALGTGIWKGTRNTWDQVVLDRANLREAHFVGCALSRCSFDTPSKRLRIQDCEVDACVFVGVLDSLLVDGQGRQVPVSPAAFSADFSRAVFRDSKIEGYSLDRVRLPEQEDLLVVRRYPGVMQVAISYLELADTSPAGRSAAAILKTLFKAPGSEDSDLCFDLGGFGDDAIADAVRKAVAYAEDGQRVQP